MTEEQKIKDYWDQQRQKYIKETHCEKCGSIKVMDVPRDNDFSRYECHNCGYIGMNKYRNEKE